MSRSKPACFGNDAEYSETSRVCSSCSWRFDCKKAVDHQVNAASASSPWAVKKRTPSTATKTNATNGSLEPITVGKALLAAGTSPYNHSKDLAPQFFRYLGYSVMEVTLEEGLNLVRSSRTHYAEENMRDLSFVEAPVVLPTEENK